MPSPTLEATLGAADANSYLTVATADAYFANSLDFEAWDGLDDDTKARALIGATLALEDLNYWGRPVTATQALKWPRTYPGESDGTTIPKEILNACCELALEKATNPTGGSGGRRAALRAAGVTSYRLGDYSETLGSTGSGGAVGILAELPARIQRLVRRWVKTMHETDSGRRSRYGGHYDQNGLWWPAELMP